MATKRPYLKWPEVDPVVARKYYFAFNNVIGGEYCREGFNYAGVSLLKIAFAREKICDKWNDDEW